jgi:hypothetical protein
LTLPERKHNSQIKFLTTLLNKVQPWDLTEHVPAIYTIEIIPNSMIL